MHTSIRSLLLFTALLVALGAQAQSERKQVSEQAGSISGRVTIGGKPAPGVKVAAFKDYHNSRGEPVASARTDQDGRFQLTGLPSDYYHIVPIAPAHVRSESEEVERSRAVIPLAEGETIEGLDFAIIRGGVITGRITGESGQPLTGERVELFQLSPDGRKSSMYYLTEMTDYDFGTDDRGIYRIFGLPPGRYLVSAGQDIKDDNYALNASNHRLRTFYPGVTDESKARAVELEAGAEASGIDIALGRRVKTYSASGHVIDASTGKPFPNAYLEYGTANESETGVLTSSASSGFNADARGNFRFDGFTPGSFYITATLENEPDLYSTAALFQIKDRDIDGLEVKISRGSSVSGVLAVEGVNDPEVIARSSRLRVWASVSSPSMPRGTNNMTRMGATGSDGSFHIAGLHPGKVFLHLGEPGSTGFSISRVERGGVEQASGIEVGPGEHVTGVRVILGYADGRIRGRMKVEGGKLPPNAEISVWVHPADGPNTHSQSRITVDPNGNFLIKGLATGRYKVSLYVRAPIPRESGHYMSLAEPLTEIVSVTSGVESEVLLVVELTARDKDK